VGRKAAVVLKGFLYGVVIPVNAPYA